MSYINSSGARRSNRFSTDATPSVEQPEPNNNEIDTITIQSNPNNQTNDNNSITSKITDADLSYHPCSSQSADPPEDSFDNYTSNEPPELSTDPTILKLKQTLIAINQRVSDMELSNTERYDDIEKRIEISQIETQQQNTTVPK